MQYIENRTFDEIRVGDCAELPHTLKARDIEVLAVMSGDANPAHVDAEYARSDAFHGVIAHGMWGGALISAVLGTELPGPGAIYLNQNRSFLHPVGIGDTVTIRVTVTAKDPATHQVKLDRLCSNQDGKAVIRGEAEVIAPTEKVRRAQVVLPDAHLHERGARYRELIDATRSRAPVRMAVIHPCDALSLTGALEAASQGLNEPILVGPRSRVEQAAADSGRSLDGVEIVDTPHSHAAAARAVELVREGKAEALMKGKLHADEMMDAVVIREAGLRTERRISHVFVPDAPHYPKPLFITDAAINIFPTSTPSVTSSRMRSSWRRRWA